MQSIRLHELSCLYSFSKYITKHQVDTNRTVWGMKANRNPVKKNTRWYAKNMYGGLNRLISRVMYGLSDAEIARLKGILENRKLNYNG